MILEVTRKSRFLEGWEFFESEVHVGLRNGKYLLSTAAVKGAPEEGRKEELVTMSTEAEKFAGLTLDY